jgi:hypothetical protein
MNTLLDCQDPLLISFCIFQLLYHIVLTIHKHL